MGVDGVDATVGVATGVGAAAEFDALAGLNATSITVPEIILTVTSSVDGVKEDGVLTFNNLVQLILFHSCNTELFLDKSIWQSSPDRHPFLNFPFLLDWIKSRLQLKYLASWHSLKYIRY